MSLICSFAPLVVWGALPLSESPISNASTVRRNCQRDNNLRPDRVFGHYGHVRNESHLRSARPRLIASGHRSCCGSDGLGRYGGLWALRNDIRHDISVHIGQTEVAAGVAVGQLLVIQPQQVQDGGVEVVEVDLVFHRVVAVVVGGPVP